jgi:hypothetical protein
MIPQQFDFYGFSIAFLVMIDFGCCFCRVAQHILINVDEQTSQLFSHSNETPGKILSWL